MINVDDRHLNGQLTSGEFYTFCNLLKRINIKSTCFPSKSLLRKETNLSREGLNKALKGLEDKKMITRKQQKGDKGKFGKIIYTIIASGCGVWVGAKGKEIEVIDDEKTQPPTPSKNHDTENRTTGGGDTEATPLSINQYEVLERLSIKQIELFLKNKKNQNSTKDAKTPQTTPKDQLPEEKEKSCDKKEKEEEIVDEGMEVLKKSERLKQTILTYISTNPSNLQIIKGKAKYRGDVEAELVKWCDYYYDHPKIGATTTTAFFCKTFPTWLINAKSKNRGGGKKNSPQLGSAKSSTYYANLDKSKIGF